MHSVLLCSKYLTHSDSHYVSANFFFWILTLDAFAFVLFKIFGAYRLDSHHISSDQIFLIRFCYLFMGQICDIHIGCIRFCFVQNIWRVQIRIMFLLIRFWFCYVCDVDFICRMFNLERRSFSSELSSIVS